MRSATEPAAGLASHGARGPSVCAGIGYGAVVCGCVDAGEERCDLNAVGLAGRRGDAHMQQPAMQTGTATIC